MRYFANGDAFSISCATPPTGFRHDAVTASTQQRHGWVRYMHQCTLGAFGSGSRTCPEKPRANRSPPGSLRHVSTLLEPLVAAWRADARFNEGGRKVIGAAMAWRQAEALQDAGIGRAYALAPLLRMIETGELRPSRNTVLVLDEVSQIAPRPMLRLLELQARTGMTI